MIRIKIAVVGDKWCNRQQVIDNLLFHSDADEILFDVNTEGPSLHALGIVDTILETLKLTNIDIGHTWVDNWHNPVEIVPFRRFRQPGLSHFFWLSARYRHVDTDPTNIFHPAALFVGRATIERAVIMYDLYHHLPGEILMSLMHNHGAQIDIANTQHVSWMSGHDHTKFIDWWQDPPVVSLTSHTVRDQYDPQKNTNADLVRHYAKFAVEIVCETYCAGQTFFVTEKTIRPLTQSKAMLVFGPMRFLSGLRNLGFRTWHDIWDESYDNLCGPHRWKAMRSVLEKIIDCKLWADPEISCIGQHNLGILDDLVNKNKPK